MAVRVRITSMPLIFLLLCSALLATTLQGVQGEVEVEGPSESECRPYIEKALKKLEIGDTQSAEIQDDDIIHTVTTDDSETQSGEAIESIISKSIEEEGIGTEEQATEEVEIDTAKEDGDSEQTGDTQEESAENKASTGEETDQTDIASEEKESGTEEAVESSEKDISLEAEQISAEKEETAEQKSAEQEETAKSQEGSEEVEQASSTEQEETQTSTEEAAASAEQESVSGTEQETTSVEEGTVSSEQQDEAPASTEQEVAASIEQEAAISTEQETAAEQEATISVEQETTSSAEQEASISAEQEATTSAEQEAATSAEQEAAVESTEQEVAISAEQEQEGVASVEESATSVEQAEDASSVEEATISVEQETAASTEDSVASTEQETTASLEQKGTTSSEDVAASTEQEGTTESVEDNAASTEQNDEAASLEEHVEISEEKSKDEASVEQREDVETNAASAEQTEAVSSEQTETTSVEQTEEAASVEKEAESVENKAENVEKEAENIEKEKVSAEVESTEGESADAEQTEKISEKVEAESTPEEDLTWEVEIPAELRSREHINEILNLNDEPSGSNNLIQKAADKTLNELKRIYENAIKPLETLYKYRDLSNRHFGDPEIFSKPLVLFMGPWSGGKSSIINYLLDNEYTQTALRTGAEPSPAYFNLVMWGEEPEVLDGTQLAADWTFSGLQKFGQGLEERLRGLKLPNKLLEKINIVEIPGILEVRKQVSRVFPFNDACQWFIDRADIIFLIYDPSKLDVGPETEAILDQLKGREYQTRIILNKADQVKPEELMRVQGALIWNISPLMSSAQPPVMYSTSLWSRPYEIGAPARLLYAQERAFLKDLKTAVDKRIENKIASARRFAVRVRNHAKMVDCYLTTYYNHKSVFGNKKLVSDQIIEHPQDYHIYEGLSTLTNISRYDLPDPDVYRDFFRLNPLYDFQQLSATCTYFRGCPINRLDVAIAYDLPELVGKYKKMVETATNNNADSSTKS